MACKNGAASFGEKSLLVLPEQLVFNMLSKCARRVLCWLCFCDKLRQWLKDDFLLWWLTENCPRNPHLLLVNKSPVKNTLVFAIAQDLNGVTNVHDYGIWDAFGCHPFALIEELETWNHVVEDESEGTNVSVSFNSKGKFWLRALGVVVNLHLEQQLFKSANFFF